MTAVALPDMLSDAARAWLDRERHDLALGAERVPAADGRTFATFDPATGRVIGTVAQGGPADVDRAVGEARAALRGWAATPARERSDAMQRLADAVEAHADELAELESLDNGKPVKLAKIVDVVGTIVHLRSFAGWPERLTGEVIPVRQGAQMLCYTRREPVGVCGQIIPWNFPLLMAAWKIAPALAAGCTIVLKPAEQTPLSALRLAELALEGGLPAGVLNVVTGDGETGAALVDHPDVDKISFTGSTAVGREIGAKTGGSLKRVTLELGGKSPNIVLPDADLDAAVKGAFQAIYYNSGQSCNAGSRLFVPKERFDEVTSRLAGRAATSRIGPGLDPGTQIGPLVSTEQLERVTGYIDAGRSEGAELVYGGGTVDRDGWFVEPTLFAATRDDLTIAREEIFGPVLVALPYESEEDLIGRANDSEYGLAAGVWTRDLSAAHRVAGRLRAGSVYVNCWGATDPNVPFGGYKASGVGREHGRDGIDAYLETKSVWTNLA